MSVDKINPIYQVNSKEEGDTLSATEWNVISSAVNTAQSKINQILDEGIPSGGGSSEGGGSSSPSTIIDTSGMLSVSSKGNLAIGTNSIKNINLEPGWPYSGDQSKYGDIALKPGDDIQFCSHHREPQKRDKVALKIIDSNDNPVKFEIYSGELAFSTKGKSATFKKDKTTGNDTTDPMFKASEAKVFDMKVLTGEVLDENTNDERDERAYLKVRAQAIDLRCEKHGGIALQPKGYDGDGNMNKIKFEHGGGDGLEFGTFNAEKTSIFTDEYRFNREGVWKMATRTTTANAKTVYDDNTPVGKTSTAAYQYQKQADDFYDIIDEVNDPQTTTEAIIKTAAALNNRNVETALSSKKNLKISTLNEYKIVTSTAATDSSALEFSIPAIQEKESYTKDELKVFLDTTNNTVKLSDYIGTSNVFNLIGKTGQFQVENFITPKVSIESEEEVDLGAKAGDVVLTAGDCIKCEAPEIRLNALKEDKSGGMINFGATQDIVFITNKLTAGLKVEAPTTPTKIKQALQNNSSDTVYWDSTNSVFRIPLKKIYIDDAHTTELNASNYSEGIPIYFADGTRVPADYTCYVGFTSESGGIYTTDIYVVATKGSEAVAKKKLFQKKVATYTGSSDAQVIGSTRTTYADDQTNYEQIKGLDFIEFEFSTFNGNGLDAVAPEEYAITNEMDLVDLFTLVDFFKNGAGQANGPWAQL